MRHWIGKPAKRLTRMTALALAGFLGACSSQGSTDYSQLFDYARKAWNGDGRTVTLKQAAAVPYASIAVRVGDGPQQMLVLATDSGRERLWTSSSHVVLATRDGRVVKALGLDHGLSALSAARSGAFIPPSASELAPIKQTLLLDYDKEDIFSVPLTCQAHPIGPAEISILQHKIDTTRVDEHCSAPQLKWSFNNTYWIDPKSGLVWRSIQHIHPNMAALEIETLRPPQ